MVFIIGAGVFYYFQVKISTNATDSLTPTLSTSLPTLKQGTTFNDITCGHDTIIWFYAQDRITESQLESVCYVSIENKNLDQFPKELYNLPNLKHLLFHNNTISLELPSDIDRMTEVIELRLDNNEIPSIPNNIGNLKHLTRLDLSSNKLPTLPNSIGNLKNLQSLMLSNNQLTIIPAEIGNLTSLQELYLENNKLTTLPEQIKSLKQPLHIYLEGNNFSLAEKQRIERLMPNATICFTDCIYGE